MSSKVETLVRAYEELYPKITDSLSEQSSKTYNDGKWDLKSLTSWRNESLPATLKQRYEKEESCYLNSEELVLLMDWKLAMGKFRPMLPKLIRSNSAEDVEKATKKGLTDFLKDTEEFKSQDQFWADGSQLKQYLVSTKRAITQLSTLKGVGPATASLILSLLNKATELAPPFFSDEAFLYFVVDSKRPGTAIKYNAKEYVEEYVPVFMNMKKNVSVKADMCQLEKGGWALKMIDTYRVDKLADIEVPDSFDIEVFDHYENSFAQDLDLDDKRSEPKKKKQRTKK